MKKYFIAALICFFALQSHTQSKYADSLRTVLIKTKNAFTRFDLLNKLAEDFYTNGGGNIDSSGCIQMMKIAQQLNNDSLQAIAFNMAGNYFLINNGDYTNALDYFFKAIPMAEKSGDKRRISSLYIDISIVYYKLNNPDEQIKYLRKALENLPLKTSPMYYFMLRQVQYYIGRYFIVQQKGDSALYYSQGLYETNLHEKSIVYECAAELLMGSTYDCLGNANLAEWHYQRANTICDSIRYIYLKLEVKPFFISYLLKNNRVIPALEQARRLMKLGVEKNNFDIKRTAAGFLGLICENRHLPDSAYYYSRFESSMKDSVFSRDNLNKMQALVFSEQLRNMAEESRREAAAEQRKLNIQYALIALGITLFLITFLLLSGMVITNTTVIEFLGVIALLIIFEFLNLLLHPFLEKLTHHSPLFMLLSLVCIAALLVPMHHRLEKWVTRKLVEKNNRIRPATMKSPEL